MARYYEVNCITLTGTLNSDVKIGSNFAFMTITFGASNITSKRSCPQTIGVWVRDIKVIEKIRDAKKNDRIFVIGKFRKYKREDKNKKFNIYEPIIDAYHVELQTHRQQVANVIDSFGIDQEIIIDE